MSKRFDVGDTVWFPLKSRIASIHNARPNDLTGMLVYDVEYTGDDGIKWIRANVACDEVTDVFPEIHTLADDIDTLRTQPEDDNTRALLMAAYGRFYDAWRRQNGGA